jgi:hypothetical protein
MVNAPRSPAARVVLIFIVRYSEVVVLAWFSVAG